MKDISKLLRKEWEAAVLVGVVAVLLLSGVMVFLDSGERVFNMPGLSFDNAQDGLVTEDGLAFLQPREPVEVKGSRPFALPDWALVPLPEKAKPAVTPRPAPKPAEKPAAAAVEKAPEEPAPAAEPPRPVVVAPVPLVGKLYFAEAQTSGDGTLVAMLQLSYGDMEQVLSLGAGEREHGITVLAVDEKAVVVQDAKKRRLRVKREGEQKLWFFED